MGKLQDVANNERGLNFNAGSSALERVAGMGQSSLEIIAQGNNSRLDSSLESPLERVAHDLEVGNGGKSPLQAVASKSVGFLLGKIHTSTII